MPEPTLSLGVLAPGRSASATLALRNDSTEAVTVEAVESSCPCVRVSPLPARIDAGADRTLTVVFDPVAEPDFRGGLAVGLTGRTRDGAVVFSARIDIDVRDPAQPRSKGSVTP